MKFKTEGLVIKEQTVGESDRLVTILTRDEGIIRAFARRAKSLKDSKNAATQLLCYSKMSIYKGKDKYVIGDAFPIEVFFGLRTDITKLALAQYFCELSYELVPEGIDSDEPLRVVLNSLSFLAKGLKPEPLLKVITELRLLSISGYMPNLIGCSECGEYEAERMYFKIDDGTVYCDNCFRQTSSAHAVLTPSMLKAMRYIVFSDLDKIYSFNISEKSQEKLLEIVEAYTVSVLQKRPKTLDFYNSLL